MSRRLCPRPFELQVLPNKKLKASAQACLNCSLVYLAMALRRMTISRRESGTANVNRHIKNCVCTQVLVVDIPGMDPRKHSCNPTQACWGRHTHRAEKGHQWNHDSLSHFSRAFFLINRYYPLPKPGKLFR